MHITSDIRITSGVNELDINLGLDELMYTQNNLDDILGLGGPSKGGSDSTRCSASIII
jgi:hypothetical protein